jgi:hypothetical protein
VLKRDEGDHFTGTGKAVYGPFESRTRNAVRNQVDPLEALVTFVREEGDERKVKAMQWGGNVWIAGAEVAEKSVNEVQVMFAKV